MRPGPIRPGDYGGGRGNRREGPRFNEARADSPGRLLTRKIKGGVTVGFNEARADSPGRLSRARFRAVPFKACFNEARADSPGRFGAAAAAAKAAKETASMRPGPIRPGDYE